jgi:hypothetical protein
MGAKSLRKFRPINLLNYSFNIFVKAINNRLEAITLLSQNQTTFVKGRYILESVVATHENSHAAMRARDKGLILKLEYEKVYDRV